MKKIYFATGNKQKLERMNLLAQLVADDFVIEKVPNLIEVEENGKTPSENALQKVEPYSQLDVPVIA
ncbi:MAG: non-canonical purine NTP pyrophosphatase [Patescibacteria group bacterium]